MTNDGVESVDASCPAENPFAVGGGGSTDAGSLVLSAPLRGGAIAADGEVADGWRATADDATANVSAYAICSS